MIDLDSRRDPPVNAANGARSMQLEPRSQSPPCQWGDARHFKPNSTRESIMRNRLSDLLCIRLGLYGLDWITQSGEHLPGRAGIHGGSSAAVRRDDRRGLS